MSDSNLGFKAEVWSLEFMILDFEFRRVGFRGEDLDFSRVRFKVCDL